MHCTRYTSLACCKLKLGGQVWRHEEHLVYKKCRFCSSDRFLCWTNCTPWGAWKDLLVNQMSSICVCVCVFALSIDIDLIDASVLQQACYLTFLLALDCVHIFSPNDSRRYCDRLLLTALRNRLPVVAVLSVTKAINCAGS